jgi:chromosome segregation ATPase
MGKDRMQPTNRPSRITAAKESEMALADILKKLTKSTKPRTAADLKADLELIDLKALEAQVDALEAERRRLLLAGDDDDVVAIGAKITAANLACERGSAARDELQRLIGEAEQREAAAAIEDAFGQADAIRKQIDDATAELDQTVATAAGLLGTISGHTVRLRSLNLRIEKAGRPTARVTDPVMLRRRIMDKLK